MIILLLLSVLGLVAGSAYQDGKADGIAEALAIWGDHETGCVNAVDPRECACSYAWGYEDECDDLIETYPYPGAGPNPQAYKRGFKVGVGQIANEKVEDCLDDPGICEGLGQNAAEIIGKIVDHVNYITIVCFLEDSLTMILFPFTGDLYCGAKGHRKESSFHESCKTTAIDFCKGGAIKDYIDTIPNCSIDSNQALIGLKKDCKPVVECLLEPDDEICDCILDGNC